MSISHTFTCDGCGEEVKRKSHPVTPWDTALRGQIAALAGTMSDADISRMLLCSVWYVWHVRTSLCVPAYSQDKGLPCKPPVGWKSNGKKHYCRTCQRVFSV